MIVRSIDTSRINPAPYNPRLDLKPGEPEFEKLRRSIGEFGLVEPLVWNTRTGHLVGGHQRFKVLLSEGARRVDVSVVDLPEDKEKALNLALNRISGGWDEERLARLLDDLSRVDGFDLSLTGFDEPEIGSLLALIDDGAGREESFDVEAALVRGGPEVTKRGEIIALGTHRLLCGDCTDPLEVRRLIRAGGGTRAALFATDPPYLVGYDGTNHPSKTKSAGNRRLFARKGASARKSGGGGNKDWSDTYGVAWDDADGNSDLYERFIRVAVDEAILPRAAWYCWHASRRQALLESAWNSRGAFVHCQIIWVKNRPVLTRTWYSWQHEPCLMGWMQGHKPRRTDRAVRSTVWRFDTLPNGEERPDHPTPKPLELFEIPMLQHTSRGDVVYEPFAGSGTQVIAAERLGRRCLAIEISPRYCDLIVRRWIAFVGRERAPAALVRRYAPSERSPDDHRARGQPSVPSTPRRGR